MEQPLIPHLTVANAGEALAWYAKALGAKELSRMKAPDGKVLHSAMEIQGARFFVSDDFPQMNNGRGSSPEALGGTSVTIHIHFPGNYDVDAAWQKALDAGATVTMPMGLQFWGDRYGQFTDPFGHRWSIGKTVKQLTPEQMRASMEEAMAAMKQRRES